MRDADEENDGIDKGTSAVKPPHKVQQPAPLPHPPGQGILHPVGGLRRPNPSHGEDEEEEEELPPATASQCQGPFAPEPGNTYTVAQLRRFVADGYLLTSSQEEQLEKDV